MTHEQKLDEFASDYAYVFSACFDKVRWRIEDKKGYEERKKLFMAKMEESPYREHRDSFPSYQRLKNQKFHPLK